MFYKFRVILLQSRPSPLTIYIMFSFQKSRSQYRNPSPMTVVYQQPPASRSSHSSHYQSASSSNPGPRELPPRVVEQAPPPPSTHQPTQATVREQIQNHPSYHQLPRADLKPFDSYFNDEPKAPPAPIHQSSSSGSVGNGPVHIEERMPRMSTNPPLEGRLEALTNVRRLQVITTD